MARPAFDRKMQLALDEETWSTLKELGEVMEKPAATLVREFLQSALPQLQQSIKMFRSLKEGALREGIKEAMELSRQTGKTIEEQQASLWDVQKIAPESVDPTEVKKSWKESIKDAQKARKGKK